MHVFSSGALPFVFWTSRAITHHHNQEQRIYIHMGGYLRLTIHLRILGRSRRGQPEERFKTGRKRFKTGRKRFKIGKRFKTGEERFKTGEEKAGLTSNATSKTTEKPSPKLRVASGPHPQHLVGSSIFPRWVPGPHLRLSVEQKQNRYKTMVLSRR